jgi:hypothetical protein
VVGGELAARRPRSSPATPAPSRTVRRRPPARPTSSPAARRPGAAPGSSGCASGSTERRRRPRPRSDGGSGCERSRSGRSSSARARNALPCARARGAVRRGVKHGGAATRVRAGAVPAARGVDLRHRSRRRVDAVVTIDVHSPGGAGAARRPGHFAGRDGCRRGRPTDGTDDRRRDLRRSRRRRARLRRRRAALRVAHRRSRTRGVARPEALGLDRQGPPGCGGWSRCPVDVVDSDSAVRWRPRWRQDHRRWRVPGLGSATRDQHSATATGAHPQSHRIPCRG